MATPDAVLRLQRELQRIFSDRLQSFVIYGQRAHAAPIRTLAVVSSMTHDDLRACATSVGSWHDAGLATPLVIAAGEFGQSLDAFPLEFGAILADHTAVSGGDPFATLTVDAADVRRACEVHARSHLLHLREGFLETRGRSDALAVLIVQSAPAFAALAASIARLEGRPGGDAASAARHVERILKLPGGPVAEVTALVGVREISSADAERIFPPYLDAVERLVAYVDGWINGR